MYKKLRDIDTIPIVSTRIFRIWSFFYLVFLGFFFFLAAGRGDSFVTLRFTK